MSKTIICDICGKKQDDFGLISRSAKINHFKKTTWNSFNEQKWLKEFDICDLCLREIHDARRKGGAE